MHSLTAKQNQYKAKHACALLTLEAQMTVCRRDLILGFLIFQICKPTEKFYRLIF